MEDGREEYCKAVNPAKENIARYMGKVIMK